MAAAQQATASSGCRIGQACTPAAGSGLPNRWRQAAASADWTRAQVALMRPEPRARALRAVVSDLMETVSGTTYFVKRISGLWQRYDLGGGHELTGRSAPDLALSDGTRLADHLHHGRGLLLDLADNPDLRARADGWPDQVRVLTARCPDRAGLSALLVRPDGFVAWAVDADHVDGRTGLDAALTSWFGAPRRAAALKTT